MWNWLKGLDFIELLILCAVLGGAITAITTAIVRVNADPVISACESLIKKLPEEDRLEGMAKCLDGADGKIDNAATKVGDP